MLSRPRVSLLAALGCLIGLALTGALAYLVPVVQVRDSATLEGFAALNGPRLTPVVDRIAHLADPLPYALIGLALAALALVRGRTRVAVAIVGLLLLTGATTQVLKQLLAHPRSSDWLSGWSISAHSWPSGHATAAMTLALCAVLAVPAMLRPTAAVLGAAFAIAVSYAILVLGWHFPSDVLGGFLVAAFWALLAVAALVALERRHPRRVPREPSPSAVVAASPIALGVAAAVTGLLIVVQRPQALAELALERPTFLGGALAIAVLAASLAVGLARIVRR
ncbi:MAG: phosphatase PAP2 family protein [Solirubrobacteraceae bacterium]|nr:phosphatase PAP2 family protein [Solirubrobacteraceae bacterium]